MAYGLKACSCHPLIQKREIEGPEKNREKQHGSIICTRYPRGEG